MWKDSPLSIQNQPTLSAQIFPDKTDAGFLIHSLAGSPLHSLAGFPIRSLVGIPCTGFSDRTLIVSPGSFMLCDPMHQCTVARSSMPKGGSKHRWRNLPDCSCHKSVSADTILQISHVFRWCNLAAYTCHKPVNLFFPPVNSKLIPPTPERDVINYTESVGLRKYRLPGHLIVIYLYHYTC